MKKTIASGLVGLIALGSGVAIAAPSAFAQEADDAIQTEQLDQRQAQREERQAQREAGRAEKTETLASALGISAEELQAAHEQGQTVADIAAAQGIDLQVVIDALVSNAQARLDAQVADGAIDSDRAAELSENLVDRVTSRVNGERPERGEGRGHHGPRGPRTAGDIDTPEVEAGI